MGGPDTKWTWPLVVVVRREGDASTSRGAETSVDIPMRRERLFMRKENNRNKKDEHETKNGPSYWQDVDTEWGTREDN